MLTSWGERLDKNNILPEYPRPQMRRDSYYNLNGEWDYAITAAGELLRPVVCCLQLPMKRLTSS